jgi:ketosteroid isomerase-like protein
MSSSQQAGGRVLVTGGAGFIGTTLARELADSAERWVVLDNLHPQVHPASEPPADLPGSVDLRVGDVTSADDLDAVVADMADDIEWHQAQGLPHGGLYRGRDEVERAIFAPLDDEWWDEFEATPNEVLDAGTEIVVLGRYTGRAKRTGNRLDVPFVHVWSLRDGQAIRFRQFLDTAGWIAALGERANH